MSSKSQRVDELDSREPPDYRTTFAHAERTLETQRNQTAGSRSMRPQYPIGSNSYLLIHLPVVPSD
jgi:hypothetical protein